MLKRVWAAGLLIVAVAWAAKEPLLECGSYFTKAQEEHFLHARNVVRRAAARFAAASMDRAVRANQDVGEIAVIGAGNGVVATRNPLDLASRTVTYTPEGSSYRLSSGTATYDTAAAAAGTRLALTDDDTRSVALPFAFPFYGSTYTSAFVNSNGTVTFGKGDLDYSGAYGHLAAGPPAIAGLFTDLEPSISSNGVRYLSEPGRVVISWDGVPITGSRLTSDQTFQIRIYSSGTVEVAYASVGDSFNAGTAGIVPGNLQPVTLLDLTTTTGTFTTGIAETFTSSTQPEIDMLAASQRFYETHDDAYDFLVFYNAMGVAAAPGVVAYELTTRSQGEGFGDFLVDNGLEYGSPRELKAVLNLGPTSQYPADPFGIVASRGVIGDTPVSILAHETGHLWLALTSVPSPTNAFYPPMLGTGLAHWAFPFHSDASYLEGNRIEDLGPGASPRYRTVATVEKYSALDQYLMGLRGPQDVPPTFAVLDSGISNTRAPQTGVSFGGTRFNISVDDVAKTAGRRTPDATVSQRVFRMAFIMVVAEDANLSAGTPAANAIAQVDAYRRAFETKFVESTDNRGRITTSLRRSVSLSLAPNAGVVLAQDSQATMTLESPAASDVRFTIEAPQNVVGVPASVTIPAGSLQAAFSVHGVKTGVEELRVVPDNPGFETGIARVQVRPLSELSAAVIRGDRQAIDLAAAVMPLPEPIVVRAVDENQVPYSNQPIEATVAGGGSVNRSSAITDARGEASFIWTPAHNSFNTLMFRIPGVPGSEAVATALGKPAIWAGGVVNGASFTAPIAPNGFASIFGGSLAGGVRATVPGQANFPIEIGGVSVLVNGALSGLVYVSDAQMNFVVPPGTAPGMASVMVRSSLGESTAVQVPVVASGPGIFFDGVSGAGAVLIAGTGIRTEERPARAGEFLEIYVTGLGVNPTSSVTIGGVNATVTYAGPTTIQGLQQVNVLVPSGLGSGDRELILRVNGTQSNPVRIRVQ